MFKVNQDSLGDVILLTSQRVSFTEVQERLIVGREVNALPIFNNYSNLNNFKMFQYLKQIKKKLYSPPPKKN